MRTAIMTAIMGLSLACGSGGGGDSAPVVDPPVVETPAPEEFSARGIHVDFTYHRAESGNVIFTVHNRPESDAAIESGMIVKALITNAKDNELVLLTQYSDLEAGSWMEWESPNTYVNQFFNINTVSVIYGNNAYPVGSANIHGLQSTNKTQVVRHLDGIFDFMGWRK